MNREQIRSVRGCHFRCCGHSRYLGVAILYAKDVLTTFHSSLQRFKIIYCNEVEWSTCRQELLAAAVPILWIILGKDCSFSYAIVDSSGHMGSVKGWSEFVVHTTGAGVSRDWQVV